MSKDRRPTFETLGELIGHGAQLAKDDLARERDRVAPTVEEAPVPPEEPIPEPPPPEPPEEEAEEMVPGNMGPIPASQEVQINVKVTAKDRHLFRLLLLKQGSDMQKAIAGFVKRCVENGKIPMEGNEE